MKKVAEDLIKNGRGEQKMQFDQYIELQITDGDI